MTRKGFIWSVLAMVLAPLGLRKLWANRPDHNDSYALWTGPPHVEPLTEKMLRRMKLRILESSGANPTVIWFGNE